MERKRHLDSRIQNLLENRRKEGIRSHAYFECNTPCLQRYLPLGRTIPSSHRIRVRILESIVEKDIGKNGMDGVEESS